MDPEAADDETRAAVHAASCIENTGQREAALTALAVDARRRFETQVLQTTTASESVPEATSLEDLARSDIDVNRKRTWEQAIKIRDAMARDLGSSVNVARGRRDESAALERVEREDKVVVRDSNARVYYFDEVEGLRVGGRIDGRIVEEDAIVEVKNRQRRLLQGMWDHERVQVEVYLRMTGARECRFSEVFAGQRWSTTVFPDDDLWSRDVLPGLRQFVSDLRDLRGDVAEQQRLHEAYPPRRPRRR
jgi:hypothetical protein